MTERVQPLPRDAQRLRLLRHGFVAVAAGRCVQCGICEHSCPMGIDVRRYTRLEQPITADDCIRCGSCVAHCPRGTLRLEDAA